MTEQQPSNPWYKKWWVITLLAIFGLIIIGSLLNKDEVNTTDNNAPSVVEKKVIQEEPQKYDLSSINYKIIETKDVSMATANRFSISVVITNNPATETQIKAVSEKVVEDYKNKADAVSILFYFEESQVGSAYTLAKSDWAPEGDWSKADLKTNQKLVYNFKDIVGEKRTDGPTAEEREINKAMKDLWYEMVDASDDPVTDEDVAKILAPQYNKTVEEMLEIRKRVSNYDLGI